MLRFFHKKVPPLLHLNKLAETYDPRGGDFDTVQGCVADAILSLHSQANRDGWMNAHSLSGEIGERLRVLRLYIGEASIGKPLPPAERAQMTKDLIVIREAAKKGADHGRMAYDELDRCIGFVAKWCELNAEPMARPPE